MSIDNCKFQFVEFLIVLKNVYSLSFIKKFLSHPQNRLKKVYVFDIIEV